ncbi:hypothetical protein [Streptomyces sp. NPDC006274]|uniref:hypothetical protein n=1 Tax=unclassified Streptomyces TaxID=2593676 RepID=UPI0033A72424
MLHARVPGRDFALFLAEEPARGVVRIEVSDTRPARPVLAVPASEGIAVAAWYWSTRSPSGGASTAR